MATTLDLYYPFDAGAGANVLEDRWRDMARQWARSGVIPGEANEFQVYADSSGMQVKVKTGSAFVRGEYGVSSSEKTLAIGPYSTNRTDLVVLRADFVNNRVELDVIAGASTTPPNPTQNSSLWEIPIATVLVDTNTSIAAGKVTDVRQFSTANGGTAQTASGPVSSAAFGAPYYGAEYTDRATGNRYVYDGTNWKQTGALAARTAWTPTWAGTGGTPSLGNGTLTGRGRVLSGELTADIHLVIGSTTAFNSATAWTFTVPVTLLHATETVVGYGAVYDSSAGSRVPINVYTNGTPPNATQVVCVPSDQATTGKVGYLVPFTFASADVLHIHIAGAELA